MNRVVIVVLTSLLLTVVACKVVKEEKPSHEIDIDCDGTKENVFLSYVNDDFLVKITASSTKKTSILQFGLAQPSRQDAICGSQVNLATSKSDAETQQSLFGKTLDGYKAGAMCVDLTISGDEECDPITVYFDHQSQTLNWWRL